MKLECEVIEVSKNGETLTIEMQGSRPGSADWRPMGRHTIQVDDSEKSCRTFYLGRRVTITIQPK